MEKMFILILFLNAHESVVFSKEPVSNTARSKKKKFTFKRILIPNPGVGLFLPKNVRSCKGGWLNNWCNHIEQF